MSKSLTQLGQEKFIINEKNFFRSIIQKIAKDECPFDDSTKVKVYFNVDENFNQYFRFEISTDRTETSTSYYPYNYNFTEGYINNVDEITADEQDVEIFTFFGGEIINKK